MSTLFTISAPSGAGKTSLVKQLLKYIDNIKVSVSHTTRKPRSGEIDGINYNFITKANFSQMLENNLFLEHAKVFDNYYGTSQEWLTEQLNLGIDIILEIDWQGAQQVKRLNPATVSIFILPPSLIILEERLRGRGTDSDDIIEKRLQGAIEELSHYTEGDYLVVNDNFETAMQDLQTIVKNQRLRQSVQAVKFNGILTELLGKYSNS